MIARVASTALHIPVSRITTVILEDVLLVQSHGHQVAQVFPKVHGDLLTTPVEELFERNDRNEAY